MTYVNITLVYLCPFVLGRVSNVLCLVGHQMPQDLTEHGTQSSVTLQVPWAHCHATLQQSMLGMALLVPPPQAHTLSFPGIHMEKTFHLPATCNSEFQRTPWV